MASQEHQEMQQDAQLPQDSAPESSRPNNAQEQPQPAPSDAGVMSIQELSLQPSSAAALPAEPAPASLQQQQGHPSANQQQQQQQPSPSVGVQATVPSVAQPPQMAVPVVQYTPIPVSGGAQLQLIAAPAAGLQAPLLQQGVAIHNVAPAVQSVPTVAPVVRVGPALYPAPAATAAAQAAAAAIKDVPNPWDDTDDDDDGEGEGGGGRGGPSRKRARARVGGAKAGAAGGSKGRASAAASGGNMSTDDAQFAAEQAQLLKQAFGRKPSTAAGGSAQGGRFSGRLPRKEDEAILAQECELLAPLIGAPAHLQQKRTTLARIVRSIASGYLRRHLTAREQQIVELKQQVEEARAALAALGHPLPPPRSATAQLEQAPGAPGAAGGAGDPMRPDSPSRGSITSAAGGPEAQRASTGAPGGRTASTSHRVVSAELPSHSTRGGHRHARAQIPSQPLPLTQHQGGYGQEGGYGGAPWGLSGGGGGGGGHGLPGDQRALGPQQQQQHAGTQGGGGNAAVMRHWSGPLPRGGAAPAPGDMAALQQAWTAVGISAPIVSSGSAGPMHSVHAGDMAPAAAFSGSAVLGAQQGYGSNGGRHSSMPLTQGGQQQIQHHQGTTQAPGSATASGQQQQPQDMPQHQQQGLEMVMQAQQATQQQGAQQQQQRLVVQTTGQLMGSLPNNIDPATHLQLLQLQQQNQQLHAQLQQVQLGMLQNQQHQHPHQQHQHQRPMSQPSLPGHLGPVGEGGPYAGGAAQLMSQRPHTTASLVPGLLYSQEPQSRAPAPQLVAVSTADGSTKYVQAQGLWVQQGHTGTTMALQQGGAGGNAGHRPSQHPHHQPAQHLQQVAEEDEEEDMRGWAWSRPGMPPSAVQQYRPGGSAHMPAGQLPHGSSAMPGQPQGVAHLDMGWAMQGGDAILGPDGSLTFAQRPGSLAVNNLRAQGGGAYMQPLAPAPAAALLQQQQQQQAAGPLGEGRERDRVGTSLATPASLQGHGQGGEAAARHSAAVAAAVGDQQEQGSRPTAELGRQPAVLSSQQVAVNVWTGLPLPSSFTSKQEPLGP